MKPLEREYDIVIAGGGITGAGVLHQAVKQGLRALLVEAKDFAWGTSGRSSKMVHGGLRYLKQGRFLMTRSAVRERQRLMETYPGLVDSLRFIMPVFDHYGPGAASMKLGLSIYSFMAGEKQHRVYTAAEAMEKIPGLRSGNLVSAVGFKDAQVDDARLVLRLIFDACDQGGTALNYTRVEDVARDRNRHVAEVLLRDTESGESRQIQTRVLINATGAFAETLHPSPKKGYHIRPLRGSHLIFPRHFLPLDQVVSFIHPEDLRPVFIFPWEGSVLLGTTDVDHGNGMETEPRATAEEADYLMEGLHHVLPGMPLLVKDCISSMAGIRPVLSRKKRAASRESREHVVWTDKGLVTVTGGKLTTFALLAADALKAARPFLKNRSSLKTAIPAGRKDKRPRQQKIGNPELADPIRLRLTGRYGAKADAMIRGQDETLFSAIGETPFVWAEVCHAAAHEQVRHLSDLLLRRVRAGLLLPDGGKDLLDRTQALCQPYLNWSPEKWEAEKKAYQTTWETFYAPPTRFKGEQG